MEQADKPWHAAYPAPQNATPGVMTPRKLLSVLQGRDDATRNSRLVLVDLRRNDHEGGTIRTSINLPAQSLYPSIPTLYSMFRAANVHTVVWYCMSSRGRGTRAAAWFGDYIAAQDDTKMQSVVLEGGIKGWVAAGEDYTDYMEEYDATKWNQDKS